MPQAFSLFYLETHRRTFVLFLSKYCKSILHFVHCEYIIVFITNFGFTRIRGVSKHDKILQ